MCWGNFLLQRERARDVGEVHESMPLEKRCSQHDRLQVAGHLRVAALSLSCEHVM
jgi:hypothetical protein